MYYIKTSTLTEKFLENVLIMGAKVVYGGATVW